MTTNKKGIILALLAAILYALSSPFSKLLLRDIQPTMMAGFLYVGAGIGMSVIWGLKKNKTEPKLTRNDLPYTILMVVLDVIAPILLLFGLSLTTAENVSLLNNFEIVATALIAFIVFKENVGKRLWIGIILIVVSSFILSIENIESFSFSFGSILVILACVSWGIENNCTRKLSDKDPVQIVIIKGFCSGAISLVIALIIGETFTNIWSIVLCLVLGFLAYGLSIYCYVYAQRYLGATKTSAFYAVAPFVGVALSFIIYREIPQWTFFVALLIMIIGTYFAIETKQKVIKGIDQD